VHLFVAYDLEWDPLEMEDGEEIRMVVPKVKTVFGRK